MILIPGKLKNSWSRIPACVSWGTPTSRFSLHTNQDNILRLAQVFLFSNWFFHYHSKSMSWGSTGLSDTCYLNIRVQPSFPVVCLLLQYDWTSLWLAMLKVWLLLLETWAKLIVTPNKCFLGLTFFGGK